MLSVVTLSIPDLTQAEGFGDNAFTEILKLRLGAGMGTAVAAFALGAMWLCGLATMTSASRMIYAFARDGGLPFAHFWAKVSPKFKTPANAIWGLAIFSVLLGFAVSLFSAIVAMATICLYVSYGLPIVARLWAHARGNDRTRGPWNLGRFSHPIAVVAILWIVLICVVFVLPPNEIAGKGIGITLVGMVALWFGFVRKRFHGPKVNLAA